MRTPPLQWRTLLDLDPAERAPVACLGGLRCAVCHVLDFALALLDQRCRLPEGPLSPLLVARVAEVRVPPAEEGRHLATVPALELDVRVAVCLARRLFHAHRRSAALSAHQIIHSPLLPTLPPSRRRCHAVTTLGHTAKVGALAFRALVVVVLGHCKVHDGALVFLQPSLVLVSPLKFQPLDSRVLHQLLKLLDLVQGRLELWVVDPDTTQRTLSKRKRYLGGGPTLFEALTNTKEMEGVTTAESNARLCTYRICPADVTELVCVARALEARPALCLAENPRAPVFARLVAHVTHALECRLAIGSAARGSILGAGGERCRAEAARTSLRTLLVLLTRERRMVGHCKTSRAEVRGAFRAP
mmetsp:Transcript_52315/g.126727  ORF Transcript_52315/g.126727 Transcript_52315/m.126727 type:complete len:359 (-) Transcript_52315:521-1597(-)